MAAYQAFAVLSAWARTANPSQMVSFVKFLRNSPELGLSPLDIRAKNVL
jgi:hypothetical protein